MCVAKKIVRVIDVKMLDNGKSYANVECVAWNSVQFSFFFSINLGCMSVHCVKVAKRIRGCVCLYTCFLLMFMSDVTLLRCYWF